MVMVCQCDMLVIGSREVRLVGVSMLECCLLNVMRLNPDFRACK